MINKLFTITDCGERVEAIASIIISANRSTDIPAFYPKWFFNRLAKGYCVWYNPFNRQQKMYGVVRTLQGHCVLDEESEAYIALPA